MGLAVSVSPMFTFRFFQTLQAKKDKNSIGLKTTDKWKKARMKSFRISGKVYFWAFDVYKFLREEYGTTALPEAFEEQEPITIKNSKTNGKSK